jgi:hypothetical protein
MTRPDLRALADVFLAGSITIDSTLHWSGVDAPALTDFARTVAAAERARIVVNLRETARLAESSMAHDFETVAFALRKIADELTADQ